MQERDAEIRRLSEDKQKLEATTSPAELESAEALQEELQEPKKRKKSKKMTWRCPAQMQPTTWQ